MKHLILTSISVLIFFALAGQEVSAKADRQQILIGEPIKLQLKAEFRSGEPITWFTVDSLEHFEVLDKSAIDSSGNDGLQSLEQTITLTSWDSGSWKIPALILNRSRTEPIVVEVGYVELDPTRDYNDIRDIIMVSPPSSTKWWWWLIFGGILAGLFMLFFPKSKSKGQQTFVPDEGAYKTAMKKLDKLEATSRSDKKLLYTELVHIFREYLHRRKNIQSFSKTSEDLAKQMTSLKIPDDQYQELLATLQLSDMVKFARFQPSEAEDEKSLEVIREGIQTIENLTDAV